jgi:TRAP-type mannitol/chloroaromatic compound transport system permease small subunit
MERHDDGTEPGWVRALGATIGSIDHVCRWSGYIVAFATLGTVLICFATVYLRYVMGQGLIWLQEAYVWTHVIVIVLGAGYTMMSGGFVRVDVFYSRWSDRRRSLSDLVMTLILLVPFLWVFGNGVWVFWSASFRADEGSLNPGGLPDLWLLKGALVVFIVLIALQGLAFVLRGVLVLSGHDRFALQHTGHDTEQTL